MKRSVLFGLAGVLVLSGCAGLSHVKNDQALSKVRKVALVGFTVVEPKAAGISLGSKSVENAAPMYDELSKSFAKKMSWNLMPSGKMKQNAEYKTAYDKTMKGFQNKYPVAQNNRQVLVEQVMDHDSLRILGSDGRAKLIKALGVDAIVSAQVDVRLTGSSIMGIGSQYPQSSVSFQVYTAQNPSTPDWFEGRIEGEAAKTSVGKTAFFDEKLMKDLAMKSARSAFAKIGNTTKQ